MSTLDVEVFDVMAKGLPLPSADLLVVADMLYGKSLDLDPRWFLLVRSSDLLASSQGLPCGAMGTAHGSPTPLTQGQLPALGPHPPRCRSRIPHTDDALAVAVAQRVCEAVKRGTEVVIGGDPKRAARIAFLKEVSCEEPGPLRWNRPKATTRAALHQSPHAPAHPPAGHRVQVRKELPEFEFEQQYSVKVPSLAWKAKGVEVAHIRGSSGNRR